MSKSVNLGLAAAALLLLWGCGGDSELTYPDPDAAKGATPQTAALSPDVGKGCPNGAVLSEAATITRLKPGGGKDPTDVMLSAVMTQPEVTCDYDKGSRKLSVSLSIPFTAKRGPASQNAPQTLSYFVAVIDTDNSVVMKHSYSQDITFEGQPALGFNESIGDTAFTVPLGKKLVGYEMLVGFQLTRDELAYNRAQHRYMP